jgi:putative transposase
MINPIAGKIKQVMQQAVVWLETRFKRCLKPGTSQQVMGTLADLKRTKCELIAENMFLCQQLIMLERQMSRPPITQRDRQVLVVLAVGSKAGEKL